MIVEEKQVGDYVLVVSRDPGLPSCTYFFTKNGKIKSPFFDREKDALSWLENSGEKE